VIALRLIPVALVLAALAPRGAGPVVERSWTACGFRESLSRAADEAEADLAASPDIAGAVVRVRSEGDHEPLKVEVTLSGRVSESRKDSLKNLVKSRFDSFACVEVVLAGASDR
jgi:hypothetical protein